MIILLQSVTMLFRRLYSHVSYYKVRQSNLITICGRLLLQGASGTTSVLETDCYYKVRQIFQSVTDFITKCGRYYKV